MRQKLGTSKGVLHPHAGAKVFQVQRFFPSPSLRTLVEHYWTVRWNLEGAPAFTQHTLPDPAVHVVFEVGRSEIVGPMTGLFERILEGKGQVFAAKLLLGAFAAFTPDGHPAQDLSTLTDRRVDVHSVLDLDVDALEQAIFRHQQGDDARAAAIDRALLACLRPVRDDDERALIQRLCETLQRDRTVKSVAEVAARHGMTTRTLQRLFHRRVGLSPKWLHQRGRLQDAAQQLANGLPLSTTHLAHSLGYADQAHFVRAFRDLIGETPAAYARKNQTASNGSMSS